MDEHLRITFIKAAIWHGSLDEATQYLTAHPALASNDIHTAAITGDVATAHRFLAGLCTFLLDLPPFNRFNKGTA